MQEILFIWYNYALYGVYVCIICAMGLLHKFISQAVCVRLVRVGIARVLYVIYTLHNTATVVDMTGGLIYNTRTPGVMPDITLNARDTHMTEQQRKDGLLLVEASERGDIETVKVLLDKGTYIHSQDGKGRCAIVAAAYGNQLEAADLLIAAGADVNMKDDTIQSAFLVSTMAGPDGYLEFMKKTLKAGADVHCTDSDNGTGLIRASDRGHVEIVRELLRTDIRVNHVNRIGWTALHEAVILSNDDERHVEIIKMLIAAGADVNLHDKDGITPLGHAKNKGFTNICKVLEGCRV